MCGRFTASFEFREIRLLFNLKRDLPLFVPRYNIAPSQEVPVIVQSDGTNELKPMRWGLVRRGHPILRLKSRIAVVDPSLSSCERVSLGFYFGLEFLSNLKLFTRN
jgi:SOS response associated peptidase (SRAP)